MSLTTGGDSKSCSEIMSSHLDLTDASREKRETVFLTCTGYEAYDVYRAMELGQMAIVESWTLLSQRSILYVWETSMSPTNDMYLFVAFKTAVNVLPCS